MIARHVAKQTIERVVKFHIEQDRQHREMGSESSVDAVVSSLCINISASLERAGVTFAKKRNRHE